MPVLSPEDTIRRLSAIMNCDDFGAAAHQVGGITKEALQEWARDNPYLVSPTVHQTKLTASDRQRQHLASARGEDPPPIRTAEVPMEQLRFHCLGPCDKTYDTYAAVLAHRRGEGIACKGASYAAVVPDPGVALGEFLAGRQVPLPQDEGDEEEDLLRAIVATLDERDLLREQVARRRTVWSSVRERLLGR